MLCWYFKITHLYYPLQQISLVKLVQISFQLCFCWHEKRYYITTKNLHVDDKFQNCMVISDTNTSGFRSTNLILSKFFYSKNCSCVKFSMISIHGSVDYLSQKIHSYGSDEVFHVYFLHNILRSYMIPCQSREEIIEKL